MALSSPQKILLIPRLSWLWHLINSISSERSWCPPVRANLILSPSGCFPRFQSQERVQGWRTKGAFHQKWVNASHGSSQSGHTAIANKCWWMGMLGLRVAGHRQASMLGKYRSQFCFPNCFCFSSAVMATHLPHKAGTVNRILEFFIGHWCRMPNAKLNQVF